VSTDIRKDDRVLAIRRIRLEDENDAAQVGCAARDALERPPEAGVAKEPSHRFPAASPRRSLTVPYPAFPSPPVRMVLRAFFGDLHPPALHQALPHDFNDSPLIIGIHQPFNLIQGCCMGVGVFVLTLGPPSFAILAYEGQRSEQ
jgi:hypothetical protein